MGRPKEFHTCTEKYVYADGRLIRKELSITQVVGNIDSYSRDWAKAIVNSLFTLHCSEEEAIHLLRMAIAFKWEENMLSSMFEAIREMGFSKKRAAIILGVLVNHKK